MTDASCLPRTIKFPMHRTLSANTELGQTKAVGLFLPLPKGKLVATQGWVGKGARQKKYLAAFHCASQDWIWFIGRQNSFLAIPAPQASQEVQWLRLFPSTEGDVGSIPGWGLHALGLSQKKKRGEGGLVIPVPLFSQDTCQKTFSMTGKAYWWFLVNCQYLKSNTNEPKFSNNP